MCKKIKSEKYFVYILRCDNNKLYTGITNDLEKRFKQHNGILKGGAKFTKAFKPSKVEFCYEVETKSKALKLEYKIKHLKKIKKEELILNKNIVKELL